MVKGESIDTLESCLGAPYRRRTYNYRNMAEKNKIALDDSFVAVPPDSFTVTCVLDTIRRLRAETEEIMYISKPVRTF